MESRIRVCETGKQRDKGTAVQSRKDRAGKRPICIRNSYTIIDPNYANKVEKKFEAGKLTSKKTDSLLRQGKTLLKIIRDGAGKDTSYKIETAN